MKRGWKELGPNGKRHGKSLQKNIQFTISGHSSSIEALVYMYMFPGKIFYVEKASKEHSKDLHEHHVSQVIAATFRYN